VDEIAALLADGGAELSSRSGGGVGGGGGGAGESFGDRVERCGSSDPIFLLIFCSFLGCYRMELFGFVPLTLCFGAGR